MKIMNLYWNLVTFDILLISAEDVLRVAKWSESLNDIFVNNYQEDPSLSWQFFGSTTGALRVFPGKKWQSKSNLEALLLRQSCLEIDESKLGIMPVFFW